MMKHAIKSLCAGWGVVCGHPWLHIPSLINGGALGGEGLANPPGVKHNEAQWQIYVPTRPLLPESYVSMTKWPQAPPSYLLEMSLHVGL